MARAKIEALNIESRSKATDITWFSEKPKSTANSKSSIGISAVSFQVAEPPRIIELGETSTTA